MIRSVTIRRFKRFVEERFDFPGHIIVLVGPNNCGKTTVLQAIAAWGLAFDRWKRLNDFKKHKGEFTKAPLVRHDFSAVPVPTFDLLWNERSYEGPLDIEIQAAKGWTIAMEFHADSTEQIYLRPRKDADVALVEEADLQMVFAPPMTRLSTSEPFYQRPKLDHLLGQGTPGDILRNLLVEAHRSERAWGALQGSVERFFGYELLPPDDSGPDIVSEYRARGSQNTMDITAAGSGFQQAIMLLTLLHARPRSVFLLDEPDAHLHAVLQEAVFRDLRAAAREHNSQLIIATHSKVMIDAVAPSELCMVGVSPRLSRAALRGDKR